MEQDKYDSLKARIKTIQASRAQWQDKATITVLMDMIDEVLDALAP